VQTPATPPAFTARNGELAWRRADIEDVLTSLAADARAILGGEVWLITGSDSWDGLIPQRDGSAPGVYSWDTLPRAAAESWPTYCQRTASESVEAVRAIQVEQETLPELVDRLRFNVTYVAEQET
jgi:hypothetical protein